MGDNPLVAAPIASQPPAFGGAYLLQDGADLADAIQSGNWVEGGMAAFSTAVDTVAAVIDPIGTLLANGLGWVLDHIEPLRGWLQDLTGNAAEVHAFAQTWANVSNQLNRVGGDLQHRLADLNDLSGETITAYRAHVQALADTVASTGTWSGAVGSGLEIASTLVQAVYELVRDGIAQVVGTAVSALITAGATLGLGTPVAVGQIVARVSSVATRVGRFIEKLLSSARKLMPLFDKLCTVLGRLFRGGHGGGVADDLDVAHGTRPAPTPDGPVSGTSTLSPPASHGSGARETPAAATSPSREPNLPDGNHYSVAYEMQLNESDWVAPRSRHSYLANEALDDAIRSDPRFAQGMEEMSPGISDRVSSVGRRRSPDASDFTWHHAHPDTVDGRHGVMQLVPKYQHTTGSPFWATLHPDGRGGFSIWGKGE